MLIWRALTKEEGFVPCGYGGATRDHHYNWYCLKAGKRDLDPISFREIARSLLHTERLRSHILCGTHTNMFAKRLNTY